MRAIVVTKFGGPDVLELTEVPDPVPGPGELLIEVATAGVGWLDTQVRLGNGPDFIGAKPPYTPGGAVAGVVSGGDSELVGQRVIGRPRLGGYAERVVVPADTVAVVPDGLALPEATTLLDDGTTAIALLGRTPVRAGEWVLVQPALGGLGSFLVQLVAAQGAKVIAAARGEHKLAMAKDLGAAEVVDYGDPQWTDQVRALTGGAGVAVAFDGVGGELGTAAAGLLADGGRFSGYGMPGGAPTSVPGGVGMEQLSEFWPDLRRNLATALAAAAEGTLRPVIGATYPLAEAASAHRDIELRRNIGKILLTM